MITFEEWLAIYKKVLSQNKKLDTVTADLLEKLNRFIFHFCNTIRYADYSKKLAIMQKISKIIADLLKKNSIKKNKEAFDSIRDLYNQSLQSISCFQENIKIKQVEDAIDNNDPVRAKQLLSSQDVANNKTITQSLLVRYCYDFKEEAHSLIAIHLLSNIKADFNAYDYVGNTPLINAILHNSNLKVLKSLVAAGADIDQSARDAYKDTPLHLATCARKYEIVELLISLRANPKCSYNPLNYLIEDPYIKLELIERLIDAGLPIDIKDSSGRTPLQNAVKHGHLEALDLMLKKSNIPCYPGIVEDAITSNNLDFLSKLITKYHLTLPNDIPYMPSSFLSEQSRPQMSTEMFNFCVANNMSLKNYSLSDRVVLNNPTAVKNCLAGTDIRHFTFHNDELYCSAIFPGMKVYYLSHYAAVYASSECLAMLIAAGLNIDEKDALGLTPLHYAAAYSNPEGVKILIHAGANINALNNNGQTPLHWAAMYTMKLNKNNAICAKILINAGADKHIRDSQNKTAFELLTTSNFYFSELKQWLSALELTPRSHSFSPNAGPGGQISSLLTITASFIANSSKLSKNLAYRHSLPAELSSEVERFANKKLTPTFERFKSVLV